MRKAPRTLALLLVCAGATLFASAQATVTASRAVTVSVFAGASGVDTGLNSGRNLSITAGADLTFESYRRLTPALEYRGMYAINEGHVDGQKNNLGGLRVSRTYGRLVPYGDILAGRGETTYGNGGYQVPNKPIFYTKSSSNVFSLGGGAEVFATRNLALKVDIQIERYSSPVTASGHLYAEAGTIGIVYVFHFDRTLR